MGRGKNWWTMTPAERVEGYATRMALLADVTRSVREHRMQECEGHPLCPGPEAADRLNETTADDLGDFVSSCLARLADQEGELESLRAERSALADRLAAAEDLRERQVREILALTHESDKWLDAWREERARRIAAEKKITGEPQ